MKKKTVGCIYTVYHIYIIYDLDSNVPSCKLFSSWSGGHIWKGILQFCKKKWLTGECWALH